MAIKTIDTKDLSNIANAIREKTGSVGGISVDEMPEQIKGIEGGATLPELENEGSASDLLSGKELIDDEGNVVTGTFTIDSELTAQDNLIAQIQSALEGKAAGGGSDFCGSLETGTLTGVTTYGAGGSSYYYYDLTDFSNKLLIVLIHGNYDFVILVRQTTTDLFTVARFYNVAMEPKLVDDYILQSTADIYDYYAV